jgi:hypothetical protein
MPFNLEQVSYGGYASLEFYLKNDPVDNVNMARPFLAKMIEGKKEWPGGLTNVVEQLRFTNDSNFQSYFGGMQVTFNRKRTLKQGKFPWGSFHDGFGLDEDELVQNGIKMDADSKETVPSADEKVALTNLVQENFETLKMGFEENFDIMLHRDGTQSATDIPGLDALIAIVPTNTVGGLDGNTLTWWRNYFKTGILANGTDMIVEMEKAWRACIRIGGSPPDFILAGDTFIDIYRVAASTTSSGGVVAQVVIGGADGVKKGRNLDGSVGNGIQTGLYFKGVEIIWDPTFATLDTLDAPASAWVKRCYFINTKHLKLRPIAGHWMKPRRPPRVFDRYVTYWGLTSKAAFTTNKRIAHAVLVTA